MKEQPVAVDEDRFDDLVPDSVTDLETYCAVMTKTTNTRKL